MGALGATVCNDHVTSNTKVKPSLRRGCALPSDLFLSTSVSLLPLKFAQLHRGIIIVGPSSFVPSISLRGRCAAVATLQRRYVAVAFSCFCSLVTPTDPSFSW